MLAYRAVYGTVYGLDAVDDVSETIFTRGKSSQTRPIGRAALPRARSNPNHEAIHATEGLPSRLSLHQIT